jgi:serine/threonine-protein kinase
MEMIHLKRSWELGEAFEKGGFGRVHLGHSDTGEEAVIKLVPKEPGASYELLFEPISNRPNIVPILDSGEWEDYYVLVMPRAEKSLLQYLDETSGPVPVAQALPILLDVAEALVGLQGEVIHRDLKPGNVLLLNGKWCLADFGIAKYAEASTRSETLKDAKSVRYAAPEQWNQEPAVPATDIYAFGVMAYEILAGKRPFSGPSNPDYRRQHLMEKPSAVTGVPTPLSSLVSECLLKPAGARPTASIVLERLKRADVTSSPAASRLQNVHQSVVEKNAEEMSQAARTQDWQARRRELFDAALESFNGMLERLKQDVLTAAPSVKVEVLRDETIFRLGSGMLGVETPQLAPANSLAVQGYEPAFEVVAYAAIAARKPRDRYDYEGRAHCLWFCDAHDEGVFRWFETAFMVQPLIPERFTLDPFVLPPNDREAGLAFSPVMASRQVAWQPVPFDQGEEGAFIERWLNWFAAAADGSLSHPSSMPESSGGRYRWHRGPRTR